MFDFPDLKSEENFEQLNSQSEVNNNILDITNTANPVESAVTVIKSPCYANILQTPNKILDKNFSIDDVYYSEIGINTILDIINTISTIKLSTSSITTNTEKKSKIIENIEIEKGFIEKVKEIENLIDNELISEIDNSQDFDTDSISKNEEINSNSSTVESTQTTKKLLSRDSYEEKLYKIENAIEDNKTLLISERLGKIYLPYQKSELEIYLKNNPNLYKNLQEVVTEKFVLPFKFFKNQSLKSRFSETYNLLKNRDGQNFIKSVSYAFKISGKRNLNPTIIASCKSQYELDSYIYYLDSNTLGNFRFFDIIYEVTPLKK